MQVELSEKALKVLKEEGIIDEETDFTDLFALEDKAEGVISVLQEVADDLGLSGEFQMTAYDSQGRQKWQEAYSNIVVNEGLDYALDTSLNGATQSTTFYIGLVGSSPTFSASDTLGSHSGWTEVTDYSEGSRQTWQSGSVSSQSIDNSGSPASFSINASVDVAGAFMADDSTKGGTTGLLFAEGSFGSTRSLQSGDTLEVTYTINAS